jgi:predicted transcriptional regulator
MNKREARVLTNEIQRVIADVERKIERAWTESAWDTLDYASWNDYCATEFECGYIKLPRGDRMKTVAVLSNAGMPQEDIAVSLGVNQSTVSRDLSRSGHANAYPDSRVTGTDGKSYPAHRDVTTVAEARERNRNPLMGAAIEQAEREEAVFAFEKLCEQVSESASELASFGYVGIPDQVESLRRATAHLTDAQWTIENTITETTPA